MLPNLISFKEFKDLICSECGLCDSDTGLCFMLFIDDVQKFIGKVVKTGKIVKASKLIDEEFINSPSGFMELICNKEFCSCYGERCKDIKEKLVCYSYWNEDAANSVKNKGLANTLLDIQADSVKNIKKGKPLITSAWESLNKKEKKRIKKSIKKLVADITKYMSRKKKNKEKAENTIKTTMFYNDDPEWIKHINEILNIKEDQETGDNTNNDRQQHNN